MSNESPEPAEVADNIAGGEPVEYRRRAQQAERRAEQLARQLQESQAKAEADLERLAAAEAQRDELADRMTRQEHHQRVNAVLNEFGVVDTEAAGLLLERHGQLSDDADDATLRSAVEKLLLDRPYLAGQTAGSLPAATAGTRTRPKPGAQLLDAAQQAARTGDRRQVARYLRLRRQLNRT